MTTESLGTGRKAVANFSKLTALVAGLFLTESVGSAALPILPEQIAVTCFSGTVDYNSGLVYPNLTSNGFVVAIFDTRTGNIGPLIPPTTSPPYLWTGFSSPPWGGFHNEPGQRWNALNLGEVFGITVDDATPPNIYVTATDCYNGVNATNALPSGPGGRGGVYKLNGTTGSITWTNLPNDPIVGPGHGNVCYRRAGNGTGYLYVSDLENGRIYRVNAGLLAPQGAPFDHGVAGRPNEGLGAIADNGVPGITQFGRRIWGLKTFQNRLFYSVWWEDSRNINVNQTNEVWSVDLDINGNFIPSTARRRISLPNHPNTQWSHPVASIDFSESGKMFMAERYWKAWTNIPPNALFGAHYTRIHRYWQVGTNWVTDPSPTHHIGGNPCCYLANTTLGASSAGGVAVNCDESIWATGDMFPGSYSSPPNNIGCCGDLGAVYGAMRIPSGGNSALAGYGYGGFAIDFDGMTNPYTDIDKFAVGAVTTVRDCCIPPPAGLAGWWPLDEPNGSTVFTDLSGNGNVAVVESGGPLGSFGSPNATPGKVAGAAYFIQASTRGRAPNSPSLNFGVNSFSADCWVNPAQTASWQPIVDKFNPNTTTGYTVGITNARVVLRVGDGTGYIYTSASSIIYGAWNFIGVAIDRSANAVRFHVNGTNDTPQSLAAAGNFNNTIDLLIGATYDTNNVSELAIDEVELFNRALKPEEFLALFAADRSGKCKQTQPCSTSMVSIFCPHDLTVQACSTNGIQYPLPTASTTCGTITNLVCTPPSGFPFPPGTTSVTCTAIDSNGNSNSCSFKITVIGDNTPPAIDCKCLEDSAHELLTTISCKAIVPDLCRFTNCFSDNCCIPKCSQTPAPGSMVGPGVYPITVTVTDCSGNSSSCTLNFVVNPPPGGCETPCLYCPPTKIDVVGCPPRMPNFATNSFAGPNCAPTGPLLVTQSIPAGTPLSAGGHTVTIQVCDALGFCTNCVVTINAVPNGVPPKIICPPDLVLIACSNTTIAYYKVIAIGNNGPVVCNPPSGSVFPVNTSTLVTCTATNLCGGSASCTFAVTVLPPPPHWPCPGKHTGIGIPYDLIGGATAAIRPEEPTFDPVGIIAPPGPPTICVFPNPNSPASGVLLQPGQAQAITFSTELDFTAVEGAKIDVALPSPTGPAPYLSFISKGNGNGYCLKVNKRFTDSPDALYRSTAIGSNGHLFSSFTVRAGDLAGYVPVNIWNLPGVTSVLVTVTLDCRTGQLSLEMPHCIWTADAFRKGWDGCIYGNSPPGRGHAARLVLTPPLTGGSAPITEVGFLATGFAELPLEDPTITAAGRKWGDGHVTLMKAYDDGESMEFRSLANGGGVHVDLGHAESFDLRLTHFENGDIPSEEQLLTRTIGPIRGLTNRPPPPFLDAMLLQASSGGVDCSADFNNIDSPTVHVLIYNGGTLVAERVGVPAQLGQTLFTLSEWPVAMGKLGGRTPCRRGKIPLGRIILPGGDPTVPPQEVMGDEFRVLAELGADAPHPDFYSSFEFVTTAGADWGVTELRRTPLGTAPTLQIDRSGDTILIGGSGEGFQLHGAEGVTGPWYNLGITGPLSIVPDESQRFYRLSSD